MYIDVYLNVFFFMVKLQNPTKMKTRVTTSYVCFKNLNICLRFEKEQIKCCLKNYIIS